MRRLAVLLAVLLFVISSVAQKPKKKSNFPELIAKAQYIIVETYHGGDTAIGARTDGHVEADAGALSLGAYPDDTRALGDMESAIQKWGKYKLVVRPENAELIFVVRKGRVADARPYPTIHVGGGQPASVGAGVNAEVGDQFDTLTIYDGSRGINSAPLWRARMAGGLDGPEPKLLQQLRKEVEKVEKP